MDGKSLASGFGSEISAEEGLEELDMALSAMHEGDEFGFLTKRKDTPEKNLVAAVLMTAIIDLQDNRSPDVRRSAWDYIMGMGRYGELGEYHNLPYGCPYCCEVLGFNLEEIRRIATKMYKHPGRNPFLGTGRSKLTRADA